MPRRSRIRAVRIGRHLKDRLVSASLPPWAGMTLGQGEQLCFISGRCFSGGELSPGVWFTLGPSRGHQYPPGQRDAGLPGAAPGAGFPALESPPGHGDSEPGGLWKHPRACLRHIPTVIKPEAMELKVSGR